MNRLNIGSFDRLLRTLLGLVMIGLGVSGTIAPWGYAGVVPLLTGLAA